MYNLESFITRHDENLYKLKDDFVFNMILHFWQAFANLCDTFFQWLGWSSSVAKNIWQ